MNKREFSAKLREMLSGYQQSEVEERVAFYSEMIDDRMEEGLTEEEAVREVESTLDRASFQTAMRKKKINAKITLIIQAALMYVAHIFFFTVFFIEIPMGKNNSFALLLLGIGAATVIAAMICGFVGFVLSAAGLARGVKSPTKTTLVVKLALIPWYLFNFFYALYLIAGSLNPWLLIAIPIEIAIVVAITYVLTLLTGIQDVFYLIKEIKDKRAAPSAVIVAGAVMQFFFVLDVVGAIMIHVALKKAARAENA